MPNINKVVYGNNTLIDLTGTTRTRDKILTGYGAFGRDGAWMDGNAVPEIIGDVYQDENNYVVLDNGNGAQIIVDPLSVTQNGTYTAPTGHAYSPVTVNVSGSGGSDAQLKALIDGSITSIDWPSGLTNIMPYAFYNRSNLTVTNFIDSIVNIGDRAFQGVNSITAPTLPSSLRTIGAYAFIETDISVTTLPDSLTSIGLARFMKCGSLTSITCNGQITALANNAFLGDSTVPMQLREARFPNMALELLSTSFGSSSNTQACKELELLDIGTTQKLNAYCLGNCRKLTKLIMRSPNMVTFNTTNSVTTAFTNSGLDGYGGAKGKIYVPSALISTYQNDTNWQTILNRGHLTFAAIEGSPYEI